MGTDGPAAAFAHLRALAAPLRYRVVPDAEGWPALPGRRGQVEYHDVAVLSAYTDHPKVARRLLAIPGVRGWQFGEQELRAIFAPEVLPAVARVLGLRTRRTLAPGVARQIGGRTAYRATSRPQDRTRDLGRGGGLGGRVSRPVLSPALPTRANETAGGHCRRPGGGVRRQEDDDAGAPADQLLAHEEGQDARVPDGRYVVRLRKVVIANYKF